MQKIRAVKAKVRGKVMATAAMAKAAMEKVAMTEAAMAKAAMAKVAMTKVRGRVMAKVGVAAGGVVEITNYGNAQRKEIEMMTMTNGIQRSKRIPWSGSSLRRRRINNKSTLSPHPQST